MEHLQIFSYNNSNVTFRNNDGVVFVNATDMAKPFGKQPIHYLRNDSTKEFLNAISQTTNSHIENLINTIQGGNNPGTWMHEDVALDFAQWLSPMFRVWCNQKIKELLTTGTVTIQSPEAKIAEGYRLAMAKLDQLEQSNKLLTQTIKEQAPKVEYVDQVLLAEGTINTTVIAKDLGMSAELLNRKLHELGVLYKSGTTWVLYSRYQDKGYTKTKTHHFIDSLGNDRTNIQTYWTELGRQFIHNILKQVKAA